MTINFVEEVQYTRNITLPVLIREVNARLRAIEDNFESVARSLRVLEFLATTESFEVTYANNTDISVFAVSLDIYITSISLRAPVTNMTVVPGISVDGVGAFTPILLDPDIPLSAIPVTNTGTKYDTLSSLAGGNALMSKDDHFQVQTSAGTQGDPLYLTIEFDIIGLSDEPAAQAFEISRAIIPIRQPGPP